jgi:hypothetical protein
VVGFVDTVPMVLERPEASCWVEEHVSCSGGTFYEEHDGRATRIQNSRSQALTLLYCEFGRRMTLAGTYGHLIQEGTFLG